MVQVDIIGRAETRNFARNCHMAIERYDVVTFAI